MTMTEIVQILAELGRQVIIEEREARQAAEAEAGDQAISDQDGQGVGDGDQ